MGAQAKSNQNSTSTYTPTAQAGAAYGDILKNSQAAAAANTYNPATGQTVAGFTDPQSQAFSNIANNQGIWQPNVNAGAENIAGAGQGIGAMDISKFYNPFNADVTNATMQQINQQDALANRAYTANEAAQNGLGGNGFAVGKAQLAGQQGVNKNATLANLNSQNFGQALTAAQADKARQLQAGQAQVGVGQAMSNLAGNDASQLLASGNQQQQQQQNVNNAASANATAEQLLPLQNQQYLANIAGAVGPLMGGTTNSTGTATQSQGKGAGSIVGPALSMASLASDERVKEDINHVGQTHDGQPIYSFKYKGDPRTQMGLMAQDVERGDHPEAVTEGIGGMKMVDYSKALAGAKPMADGGRMGMSEGLMGWAPLHSANPIVPSAPSMSAPSMQKEEFDPQAAWDMGKKARSGISSLFADNPNMPAASSPAGGALAASGLQAGGGGGGIMSGLSSLFGFADGGSVYAPTEDELHAIEMQESGGNPNVVSSAGARGRMQVMPETGRQPGYGVTPLRDQSDAENMRFGRDYYTAMLNKYGGDRDAAMIAYNGGPARADNWLKSGRDDSVIPAESANYYKQTQGRMTPGGDGTRERIAGALDRDPGGASMPEHIAPMMAKATTPTRDPIGEPYQNKADRKTGGLLNRVFGIDFNPLNLDENERRAMLVAGLSMWSSGDIGKGGLTGMQYLAGAEAGQADRRTEAGKLAYQMKKDADELALRTRGENRMESKDTADQTWREGEVERKNRELTNDQKEYNAAKAAGENPGTFTEFQQAQKKASALGANSSLPAEVAARIEMGRTYQRMLPDIETRIGKLNMTTDRANLLLGRGEAGSVWRDIETGRDALLRSLTGAGMSITEAQNAVDRYQISSTDKPETMIAKARNLDRDLKATEKGAIEGKSGDMVKEYRDRMAKEKAAQGDGSGAPVEPKPAPKVGTVIRGHRFKGGDPAAEASWEAVQ